MAPGFRYKILHQSSSFGKKLKKARLRKGLSLREVALKTQIRYPYLKALEEERFKSLPPEPYGSFFVKRYAQFLGLSSKHFVLWYQREINVKKPSLTRPPEEIKFSLLGFLRRKLRYILAGILLAFAISSFLAYEVASFTKGPFLKIVNPAQEKLVASQPTMILRGVVDEEASLKLNGTLLEVKEGTFEQEVVLKPGYNRFVFEAEDTLGRKTEKVIEIWRR
ncbi:helix-turn-helix domain-containing protein [bacterium]|nr:helix-turn-helix domain-containing protein [bacterium]